MFGHVAAHGDVGNRGAYRRSTATWQEAFVAGGPRSEGARQVSIGAGRRRPRLYLPWPLVPVAVLVYLVIVVVAAPFWLIEKVFGPVRSRFPGR
jgi:hypothetical protein